MNWKLIVVGGLVFFVVTFIVGYGTGELIHNGVLKESYKATQGMWKPALEQDPPDMGAVMPYWITTALIGAFILAAIYGCVRSALSGPGWKKGLVFGLILWGTVIVWLLDSSGVFHLPNKIWIWWAVDKLILYLPGAIALGWVGAKVAPE